jgi:hypothetical protein
MVNFCSAIQEQYSWGHHKPALDFKDVQYFGAKKGKKPQEKVAKKAPEEVYNGPLSLRKAQICRQFMICKAIDA